MEKVRRFPIVVIFLFTSEISETINVRALRLSFIGELGFELHIPHDKCVEVYNKLWEVGRPYGLGNVGYRSFYSMSCEKGIFFGYKVVDMQLLAELFF